MPSPNYPLAGNTLTNLELRKRLGAKGPLYEFLSPFALGSTVNFFDDFALAALDLSSWTIPAAGATATTWAITLAASGLLRGITGTTAATSGLKMNTPAVWLPTSNMGCEVRYRTSDITENRIEIGFVNAMPTINVNMVNSLVTPTFTTTVDAALFVYDNASAATTSGLYTVDSTAVTGIAQKVLTTTNRPVNATFQTIRLTLQGAIASLWVDGVKLAVLSAAIKPAATCQFVISTKASSTTSQNLDIDYVRVWEDRV